MAHVTESSFQAFSGNQAELPKDLFVGRALASLNCGMCGIKSGGFFRRDGFILEGRVCEGAGHRIGHDFQRLF